jgi:hypothetical protein
MPNWVEQTLHVVGARREVDRFIRTGYVRRHRGQFDDLLYFTRLCPLGRRERKDTYTHESGVVLIHFRTMTQAMFSLNTSWDYPREFYARLATHWPALAFICSVNEEMGGFGGVVMALDGSSVDLVRDYDVDYNRRAHGREIGRLLKQWSDVVTTGRPWRLVPDRAWDHRTIPFDAHFDDDFWFYFRTREELAAFRPRYRSSNASRLLDGKWKRIRFPRRRR